jgi:hypothetical protein
MLNINTHVCSIYSTFSSQQPPSSARVPATRWGRVLHLTTSYTVLRDRLGGKCDERERGGKERG